MKTHVKVILCLVLFLGVILVMCSCQNPGKESPVLVASKTSIASIPIASDAIKPESSEAISISPMDLAVVPFEFNSSEFKVNIILPAEVQLAVPLIIVEGHADVRGSDSYNLELSRRRAQSVADDLLRIGATQDMIELRAVGSREPICKEMTEECHARNRRVVVKIIAKESTRHD